MGRRGPKPEPTALRVLKDNPGKRPLPNEPKSEVATLPEPPRGLGAAGAALWKRVGPQLITMGCLTEADHESFRVVCEAWQDYCDARTAWNGARRSKVRRIYATPNGTLALHPSWKLLKDCRADWIRLSHEFGLTPAARQGMHVEAGGELEGEDDTLD